VSLDADINARWVSSVDDTITFSCVSIEVSYESLEPVGFIQSVLLLSRICGSINNPLETFALAGTSESSTSNKDLSI